MIAATPRSGSTFFCIECWRTGLLGAPMEYANIETMGRLWNRVAYKKDISSYWDAVVQRRTSPNGIFGYKMFPQNYTYFAKKYPEMLQRINPTHVVYLTREDRLSQAISLGRAVRSAQWFADGDTKKLDYDETNISSSIRAIETLTSQWERIFELTGTQPLRVSYEEFLKSPAETMERVVDFIGEPRKYIGKLDIPNIEIQRDAISEDWRQKYLHVENLNQ
jgi:LPS sulfotransferase NodH